MIITGAMMMIAVSQLLGRSLAYVLIALSVGQAYSLLAVISDVSLFFLYKLTRQDFYYQIRVNGMLRFVGSVIERFICKIMSDCASLMSCRSANEMGGKFVLSSSLFIHQTIMTFHFILFSLFY
jgi:hypothetical protein